VFIIGPDKKLKLTVNYPASVGRNMVGNLRAPAGPPRTGCSPSLRIARHAPTLWVGVQALAQQPLNDFRC
jgi:hypothetical protein